MPAAVGASERCGAEDLDVAQLDGLNEVPSHRATTPADLFAHAFLVTPHRFPSIVGTASQEG
jgi:hypothetical protein